MTLKARSKEKYLGSKHATRAASSTADHKYGDIVTNITAEHAERAEIILEAD